MPWLPGVNTPHVVHYAWWLKADKFFIELVFKSYEDTWGVVHEVMKARVATDIFGVPKDNHATVTFKCGGGVKATLAQLRDQTVSCWDCLSR